MPLWMHTCVPPSGENPGVRVKSSMPPEGARGWSPGWSVIQHRP